MVYSLYSDKMYLYEIMRREIPTGEYLEDDLREKLRTISPIGMKINKRKIDSLLNLLFDTGVAIKEDDKIKILEYISKDNLIKRTDLIVKKRTRYNAIISSVGKLALFLDREKETYPGEYKDPDLRMAEKIGLVKKIDDDYKIIKDEVEKYINFIRLKKYYPDEFKAYKKMLEGAPVDNNEILQNLEEKGFVKNKSPIPFTLDSVLLEDF